MLSAMNNEDYINRFGFLMMSRRFILSAVSCKRIVMCFNNIVYRENIRKMIEQTEDTPALCCTYTMIKTHLIILAEKGSAV